MTSAPQPAHHDDPAPDGAGYSAAELLAVMAARRLRDGMAVFAGVGLPLVAAVLARRSHAPGLQIVVEGGVLDPEMLPGRLPISTNEMRVAHRASMLMGITDTFLYAQRGYLDLGFIGGAQVDRFVLGPASHAAYLAQFDPDQIARQRRAARELVGAAPVGG